MNSYTIDDFEHLVNATMLGQGTEAFDIKGSFTKLLGGAKKYFYEKLRGFDKPMVVVDMNGAKKITAKYNYTDLMDRSIFIPGRLNMPYNEWIQLLTLAGGYCARLQTNDVPAVSTWVAACLNDKASTTYTPNDSQTDKLQIDIEKKLTIALNGKDNETTTFGMMYSNMSQFNTSYAEQSALVQTITRRGPAELRVQVERLAVLADELYTQISSGEVNFTSAQLKAFSALILRIARATDLYSVIMSLIITTTECMNNNVSKLVDVKK